MSGKGLIVLAGVVALVVLSSGCVQDRADDWKNRYSLASIAKQAKADGKTSVTVTGPIIEYAGSNIGFEEARQLYSIVVAEPLEARPYSADSEHIVTWYRCRVREAISIRPPLVCDTCPVPGNPPVGMGVAREGEFLISRSGGTVLIDNVEVTMTGMPDLKIDQSYVMFASINSNGVALFVGGPVGLFRVGDNDSLEPVVPTSKLGSDMQRRFSLKLSRLRASS